MSEKKNNFLIWFQKISRPAITGNATAKLFFLFLSIFLWCLIKLSQGGYEAVVRFPVEYVAIPEDRRLLNKPLSEVEVRLRGKGFEILKQKLQSFQTIAIDVSRLEEIDSNHFVWNTEQHMEQVSHQFGDNVEVLGIEPERVVFDFSPVESKRLKIYLKGNKEYSNFKTLYKDPKLSPDSLTIWGTAKELQEVDSIFTQPVALTAESDSVQLRVRLQLPEDPDLRFSAREVQVNLRFTSLTERTVEIPIEVVRLPPGYAITLVPEKVNLTYRIAVEDFSKVSGNDFSAFVDLEKIEEGNRFLEVQLESVPALVRQTQLHPRKVEYILSEK